MRTGVIIPTLKMRTEAYVELEPSILMVHLSHITSK